MIITNVSLPRVNDAIIILVEEGDMLLKNCHSIVIMPHRPCRVAGVRRHQRPRQIWSFHNKEKNYETGSV